MDVNEYDIFSVVIVPEFFVCLVICCWLFFNTCKTDGFFV